MRVGPMPILSADKLLGILEKNGHEAHLQVGADELTSDEQKALHPRAVDPKELCYVEFDDAHFELVRKDLIRLGLISTDEHVSTGDELEGTDWMCPKCGKVSTEEGLCSVHQVPLVSFEDYAAGRRSESTALPSWVWAVLVAMGGALYFFFGRH